MTTKTQKGDFIAIGLIEALVYQPAPHLPRFVLTFRGGSIVATHCQSGETIRFDARTPALSIKDRLNEEILDIMRDDEPIVWIDIDDFMAAVA